MLIKLEIVFLEIYANKIGDRVKGLHKKLSFDKYEYAAKQYYDRENIRINRNQAQSNQAFYTREIN